MFFFTLCIEAALTNNIVVYSCACIFYCLCLGISKTVNNNSGRLSLLKSV